MKGVCGLDYFKESTETYSSYFKHQCINGDITLQSTKEELYNVVKSNLLGKELDLVAGGFHCQGFSMVGKRMIEDPRNVLYKELFQVINHLKPRFILFENVKGICSMNNGEVIKQIVEDARNIGYVMKFETLNSADYYVPQKRERVIFIGLRRDLFPNLSEEEIRDIIDFPKPFVYEEDYVSVGCAILDLIDLDDDP